MRPIHYLLLAMILSAPACNSTRNTQARDSDLIEVDALVYWWEGRVMCEVKAPEQYRRAQFSIDGVSSKEIPRDSIGRWQIYLPTTYREGLRRQMSYFASIDSAIAMGIDPANVSDSWVKFGVDWKKLKRKPEMKERQPNQALQTTSVTSVAFERVSEFDRSQRGV